MPDTSDPLRPHSTKPAAKAGYVGSVVHSAKHAAYRAAPSTSRCRREKLSAQAPDGTSSTTWVADQITKSDETWLVESPASVKSRA